jgi:hypothetical protein
MTPIKPHDCVLFIDEEIARFIIAWGLAKNTENPIKSLTEILSTSSGQVRGLETRCRAVGIITADNLVSELAQKCINGLIAKRIKEFQ